MHNLGATACPSLSVSTVRDRAPLAKLAPAPWFGNRKNRRCARHRLPILVLYLYHRIASHPLPSVISRTLALYDDYVQLLDGFSGLLMGQPVRLREYG